MALPTYSTGTVAVTTGGAVTVTSGIWSGTNVVAGDMISVDGGATVLLSDVSDVTHGQIAGWTGGAVSGKTYVVYQDSSLRFDDVAIAQDLQKQVAALNTTGFIVFVPSIAMVPDPSLGDDAQWATQPSTGAWWQKTGGLWVSSVGPVKGYGGTSTTSLAIGTGSKVFTTQAGLAYTNGARVRASSNTDISSWMEGLVAYSGTTLTMTADKTNGAGTFADWNLNVVGEPGGGVTNADVASITDLFRGLSYYPNATTPTTKIDVTAGECRDSLNTSTINLAATITKDVTAAWVAGSGNGSLDTGTVANGFYHIHAIYNPTSGVSDVLTSTSMTAPTMPAGYTARRWIGAFSYASGIYDFITVGEWHHFKTRAPSVSSAANNTTATNRLLAVPIGAKCEVEVYLQVNDSTFTSGPGGNVTIRDPDLGPYTPSASTGDWYYNPGKIFSTRTRLFTSNTGYVSTGDSNTSGTGFISISTEGWRIDRSVYR